MSLGVVTGIADRALRAGDRGYCAATAVLFKRFWAQGDFWARGDSKGRTLFWDFLKNLSLGAGFLLIVVGTDGSGLRPFLAPPACLQPPLLDFAGATMSNPGPKPSIPYWHLYVDEDGVSHQRECRLTGYELGRVGAADPQWNNEQGTHPSTVVFTVQPVGWVGEWHENPAPQWIVVLSGSLVHREHGRHADRAGRGRVLLRRRSGLHRDATARRGIAQARSAMHRPC